MIARSHVVRTLAPGPSSAPVRKLRSWAWLARVISLHDAQEQPWDWARATTANGVNALVAGSYSDFKFEPQRFFL
jgi:hypothetical protein